jgi:hypothetical protein
VAVRDRSAAAFAFRRPAAKPRHLGREAAFVDEEEALRIETGLTFEPCLTFGLYIRALLL